MRPMADPFDTLCDCALLSHGAVHGSWAKTLVIGLSLCRRMRSGDLFGAHGSVVEGSIQDYPGLLENLTSPRSCSMGDRTTTEDFC